MIDKPEGPTSREVLDGLEARLGVRPLGHAGTLDPLASGLLVGLAGVARRLQEVFLAGAKVYESGLRLGFVSGTLDREGPVTPSGRAVPAVDGGSRQAAAAALVGVVAQVPPAHAAVHVAGRRAHELARRGEAPALAPRRVRIDAIDVLAVEGDRVSLRMACGAGTYIRSLARDLGEALGCGAYLERLRRTRSGGFSVEDAAAPDALDADRLRPLAQVLAGFPRVEVDARNAARLAQGAWVPGILPSRDTAVFAWHAGEPLCRLVAVDATRVRSDLLLRAPAGR